MKSIFCLGSFQIGGFERISIAIRGPFAMGGWSWREGKRRERNNERERDSFSSLQPFLFFLFSVSVSHSPSLSLFLPDPVGFKKVTGAFGREGVALITTDNKFINS